MRSRRDEGKKGIKYRDGVYYIIIGNYRLGIDIKFRGRSVYSSLICCKKNTIYCSIENPPLPAWYQAISWHSLHLIAIVNAQIRNDAII